MSRESLLYFIAAALFLVAAGIRASSDGIELVSILMLVTAAVLGWVGLRKRVVR